MLDNVLLGHRVSTLIFAVIRFYHPICRRDSVEVGVFEGATGGVLTVVRGGDWEGFQVRGSGGSEQGWRG